MKKEKTMAFQIIRNNIIKVKADAIVNTANPEVHIGSGVDTAIYNAAGRDKLLAARAKLGRLSPGEVGVTGAYDLNAKYIIHVSGPRWQGGDKGEADILRRCYDKALEAAKEKECESIAFPLMATGSYKFPKRLGMEIAVAAFTDFLLENEMEITLVVFGNEATDISGELAYEVKNYIGDAYVEEALSDEYESSRYLEDEIRYSSISAAKSMSAPMAAMSDIGPNFQENGTKKKSGSLEDTLKSIYTDSFEKHLQQLINKKGLKNSQVYTAANISKQYFSKLLKGQVKPSKEKVLALAVGLRLNLDEAVDFLRIAGYALSPISQTDAVVEYFIEHEDYSVMKIDIVLFDYGLDPLSKG